MSIIIGNIIGIPAYSLGGVRLPICVQDIAISWYKNLDNIIDNTSNLSVIDFDGIDDTVNFPTLPDINQTQKLTFKMYIDNETGYYPTTAGNCMFSITDTANAAYWYVGLRSNTFYATTDIAIGQHESLLTGISGRVIDVEIIKSKPGAFWQVDSVKFDDSTITSTGNNTFTTVVDNFDIGSVGASFNLQDATIWDIKLYNSSNSLIHYWTGSGTNANEDIAWVDQVGAINGTVVGSPLTRNVVVGIDYIKDEQGTQNRDIYYGQYLTNTSGQINFYRTSGTFDYTDPSTGNQVIGTAIPGTGLFTVPVNGICDIGIYPKSTESGEYFNFDGVDDKVVLDSIPDITGNKTITFNMNISSSYTTGGNFIVFDDGGDDIFQVLFDGTRTFMFISVSSTFTGSPLSVATINITPYYDIDAEVIIVKTGNELTSITINGDPYSLFTTGIFSVGDTNVMGGPQSILLWDVDLNSEHAYTGYPNGSQNSAWIDTIGSINGTVQGVEVVDIEYTSFYPACERTGTVLHDTMENSIHMSVATPDWDETLYGSDYLNQTGYVTKTQSDALGYDWNTLVNGSYTPLNINTLIPLGRWSYVDLQDVNGVNIQDVNGEQLQVKQNI